MARAAAYSSNQPLFQFTGHVPQALLNRDAAKCSKQLALFDDEIIAEPRMWGVSLTMGNVCNIP